ncbi:dihydrolipoamide acetyltransferase family protein [Streptomyces fragilis]|uniref:Dihydrolipoamide acetyltransferase component of pyruvate dehydrogenase complex n=1 Tax=Streptomyces fragilis TaxID=67301 RepID=A0ABV2YG12_9ACTN|nr:dihydrolipoamide acetyltransferase family protein [Streptomyces fragilis]
MAEVFEFKLPDLGEGLTEAQIVQWMVEVGDVVAVDQPVVEVETAKAMVEVPCPYGGVVTARYGEEGGSLPVGAPLITVAVGAAPGDLSLGETGAGVSGTAAGTVNGTAVEGAEGSGNVLVGYGTSAPPARRRRVPPPSPVRGRPRQPSESSPAEPAGSRAAEARSGPVGADSARSSSPEAAAAAAPSSVNGTAAPVRAGRAADGVGAASSQDGPVPVISPLVRRLARDNGLDLREINGSGPEGLILRADVEYALRAMASRDQAQDHRDTATVSPLRPVDAPVAADAGETRIPLRGLLGAAADKFTRSRSEIPDATCWVDADATELLNARAAMNAGPGPKISLIALLARICVAALDRFPELNATVDTEAREIVRFGQVHIGFAAQTPRGLVVPVVRDAHRRDAESLTGEFSRLTESARSGGLRPAELSGSTFTLNNYGVFGVDGSTPILNHPEAAMLGVGRITPKPWVHQGELAVRHVTQLSLTFDHRVCDGGTAGGFLRYVADCIEQPAVLLRSL